MTHDAELITTVCAALADNRARVQRIEHHGQFVWIKRRETLTPLRRLQKGDAAAAFAAERRALHDWHRLGAPAPKILAEGDDFLALADSGQPLDQLLSRVDLTPAERLPAFRAAATALAKLHAHHISHGRPSLKDICWDGSRITFLDLERYTPRRNTAHGHAMDLVMFVFNGLSVGRGVTQELTAAIETYRAQDPGGIWDGARRLTRRLKWIDWLTKPIQWRGEGKAKEFKAIPLTLAAFAQA